jgi:D-alanyl-lipoteichoic acid acyltransferase DltB (MBOAT superfamily)
MYFPQLVAGPIERPQNMLFQFHKVHIFDYHNFTEGLKHIIWGLFKKVVIADRISEYVNTVYNNPHDHHGTQLLMATFFFSFQIYCDFSGYSSIAIGTSRIFGIKLMTNFNRPYLADSIRDFWKRWHISLSSWFKDYLYIPLGGNRVPVMRGYFNLFFVFLVSGLWHGANWTFVIWGALHGFYSVFATISQPVRNKINHFLLIDRIPFIYRFFQMGATFLLASFAWIFFRATSLEDAMYIVKNIFRVETFQNLNLFKFTADMYLSLALVFLLITIEVLEEKLRLSEALKLSPVVLRYSVYAAGIIAMVVLGVWKSADFIYFQF